MQLTQLIVVDGGEGAMDEFGNERFADAVVAQDGNFAEGGWERRRMGWWRGRLVGVGAGGEDSCSSRYWVHCSSLRSASVITFLCFMAIIILLF